jgi:hypothetical protein
MEATSGHPELLTRIKIKALAPEICGKVGKQATLNAEGGLTEAKLCE